MDAFGGLIFIYFIYCLAVVVLVSIVEALEDIFDVLLELLFESLAWLAKTVWNGVTALIDFVTWHLYRKDQAMREWEEHVRRVEETRRRWAEDYARREQEKARREKAEAAAKARADRERHERQKKKQGQAKAAPLGKYEAALALLGLKEPVTEAAFTKAFRAAMMRAHPDRGGSDRHAQALNVARAVIRNRHGW